MTSPSDPRSVWIRQTAAVPALGELVAILGVRRVLPVKGIVTARTLYSDTAERSMRDLDVRVAGAADLDELVAAAQRRGHVLKLEMKAYRTAVLDVFGVDVDVECAVGPPGLCALDVATMLARADVRDDLFGFPCAVPELHDHALLLAINAFKDKLSLAQQWQIEDCARVVDEAAFDPVRFVALAREARCLALVCVVADWLAPKSARWRDVRAAAGPRPPRRGYVRAVGWLFANAPESIPARISARLASDDRAMRFHAIASAARYLEEKRRKR